MTDVIKSLLVIPARGGSKRLPGKNIMDLGGKPLIAHTIEAAIGAQCFSAVMVSTDDPEIGKVARAYTSVVVDDRDTRLAGDEIKVVDVIHVICNRQEIRSQYDVVGMMLPTAPFRRKKDIQEGMSRLTREINAVLSFAPYEFPPEMAVSLESDEMLMRPIFEPSPLLTGNTRTQDQTASYRPNGSFYFAWISSFLKCKSFFKGRVSGVVMTRLGSVDIDEHADMALARLLIQSSLAESDFL